MRASARRLIQPGWILFLLALDRATKVWAVRFLEPVREIPLFPFFHLTYVENTGAAWGMLQGRNAVLIVVSVALLGGLLYMRRKWPESNARLYYGTALVAGGALGNLYDRIVYGYVVDFFDFIVWPVFNIADSCITVGACLLAWGLHLEDKREAKEKAESA